ncbi:LPS assembly lipoprotein LptE [Verrucomicrobiaceae bacterium 227]
MRILLTILCLGLLSSCAGYRWGGNKPSHLSGVQSIYIPLAKSHVIFPRVEALVTNSVVDAFTVDGTYRIGSSSNADATLLLTLEQLTYRQARSSVEDVLLSEELRLEVIVSYQLIDLSRPGTILGSGKGRGHTRLFVDDNLQTARASALPDALQRAATDIVARLADGI